jgi:hypothetical protein
MASTTRCATLSMWSVVTWLELWSCWRVIIASCWDFRVVDIDLRVVVGMGRMKGGWSRVVGKVGVEVMWGLRSPICGIVANRAL